MKLYLFLLCLLFTPLSFAQDGNYPTCDKTLLIPMETFTTFFYQSEIDADLAAGHWGRCLKVINDERMAGLENVEEIHVIRIALSDMATSLTELQLTRWHGGTLYTHSRARYQPNIEVLVSELIDLRESEQAFLSSEYVRGSMTHLWDATVNDWSRLERTDTKPFAKEYGVDPIEFGSTWEEALISYYNAYISLQELLKGRQDIFTYHVLEFWLEQNHHGLEMLELPDSN